MFTTIDDDFTVVIAIVAVVVVVVAIVVVAHWRHKQGTTFVDRPRTCTEVPGFKTASPRGAPIMMSARVRDAHATGARARTNDTTRILVRTRSRHA